MTKLVDYRTFFVYYDDTLYDENRAIEKLKKYNHIESISPFSSYLIPMTANDYIADDKNSSFFLLGAQGNPIDVYKGKNLSSYKSDEKVMICADKFYPYQDETAYDTSKEDVRDLTNRIGEMLPLSFINSKKVEYFKLIGVYNAELNKTNGNLCYTNFDVVSNLNLYYQSDFYNQKEARFPIIMVVDTLNNINDTLVEIKKDGFYTNGAVLSINSEIGNEIINIIGAITTLICILTISIVIFISFRDYRDRKKNFGILKSMGFKNKEISMIYYYQTSYQLILSTILSIILNLIYMLIFKKLFISKYLIFNGMNFELSIFSIIISTIIIFVISLSITFITNISMNSKPIINMIKE